MRVFPVDAAFSRSFLEMYQCSSHFMLLSVSHLSIRITLYCSGCCHSWVFCTHVYVFVPFRPPPVCGSSCDMYHYSLMWMLPFIAVKTLYHCSGNRLSLQWMLVFIGTFSRNKKRFNECFLLQAPKRFFGTCVQTLRFSVALSCTMEKM